MSKRLEFSKLTRQIAYGRAGGHCEICSLPLKGVQYHHRVEAEFGGDNSIDNCMCLCVPCHKLITKTQSAPLIAKSNRILNKRKGITAKKKSWGYGKNDRYRKKLNGSVVLR